MIISRFIVCPNPTCITNAEGVESLFSVEAWGHVRLRCAYCERVFRQEEIKEYNL